VIIFFPAGQQQKMPPAVHCLSPHHHIIEATSLPETSPQKVIFAIQIISRIFPVEGIRVDPGKNLKFYILWYGLFIHPPLSPWRTISGQRRPEVPRPGISSVSVFRWERYAPSPKQAYRFSEKHAIVPGEDSALKTSTLGYFSWAQSSPNSFLAGAARVAA
jgi:hypothetical protein